MIFRLRANCTFEAKDLDTAYIVLSEHFLGMSVNFSDRKLTGEYQVKPEETKEVDDKYKRKYQDVPVPFGNFKDMMVAEVPDWYLDKCLLEQDWIEKKFPEVFAVAKQERAYRDKWHIKVTE